MQDVPFPAWDARLPAQHQANPMQEKPFPALELVHPTQHSSFPT
jgi:hypothetical protein